MAGKFIGLLKLLLSGVGADGRLGVCVCSSGQARQASVVYRQTDGPETCLACLPRTDTHAERPRWTPWPERRPCLDTARCSSLCVCVHSVMVCGHWFDRQSDCPLSSAADGWKFQKTRHVWKKLSFLRPESTRPTTSPHPQAMPGSPSHTFPHPLVQDGQGEIARQAKKQARPLHARLPDPRQRASASWSCPTCPRAPRPPFWVASSSTSSWARKYFTCQTGWRRILEALMLIQSLRHHSFLP